MDFISSLPEQILHHILSFDIPTNLAIKTCVLSKRWRHVWREVPCLSLECDLGIDESYECVDQTLIHHKAHKLLSFHLDFRFKIRGLEYPEGSPTSHQYFILDTWIAFALSHHPENLSLDFFLHDYSKYIVPDKFYVNSSVKRLTLAFNTCTTLNPRVTVFWPSLTNLCLDCCNISDESAAKILSGCPFLESLTLNSCRMLERLDLSKSINLTRLEIYNRSSKSGPTEIVAPHIRYLSLITSSTTPSRLDRVSSLTQAKLDLSTFQEDSRAGFLRFLTKDNNDPSNFPEETIARFLRVMNLNVLPNLHNVEKLTLGSKYLKVLSVAQLRGVPFPMLKITTLTLETKILRFFVPNNPELHGVPGIAKLLQNSPTRELKKLTLHLKKGTIVNVKARKRYMYMDSQGMKSELFPTSWEPIECTALFIELVLRNTKTLETLVVRLDNKLDEENFEELLQMAQTLPQDYNNVSIVIKHKV